LDWLPCARPGDLSTSCDPVTRTCVGPSPGICWSADCPTVWPSPA
jgi:hypothetical protein